MNTAVIGQFLATSLYQAISETLPLRLGFYESWLTPRGFRARHVYVAGVRAVFSFLRQEDGHYDAIMRRAGSLSARWVHDDLPPMRRALLRSLPGPLRYRAALFLARHVIGMTWSTSRVTIRWRGATGHVAVARSLFCDVRDAAPAPLCAFYVAAIEVCLELAGLGAEVRIEQCHAQQGGDCAITVTAAPRPTAATAAGPAATAIALLLAAALPATVRAQSLPPAERERVLVMPFENASRQPRLAWLSEGSSILLADELRASGVEAMTRDERLRAFERFQVPPLASLSRATVIRIGELVGADDVVIGSLAIEADALVLRARRVHLETGRLDPEMSARGPVAEMARLYRELGARLWAGEAVPEAAVPASPAAPARTALAVPLAAFEQYVKGLVAEPPSARVPFLAKAIQIHPDFPAARIALAQSRAAAGEYRLALEALEPVGDSGPQAVEARLLAAVAHIALRDYTAAYQVLAALQARAPSALFLNDLGVVRIRAAALPPGAGSATWYFSQARTLDPLDPDYLFNLGYAYWLEGNPQGASYWLQEAVRLSPTDAAAHALLAQVLHAAGQAAEAARELALAQRLSSDFAGTELKAGALAAPPRGLERLKDALEPPRAQRIDAALEMVGQREQRELSAFYLGRGRRAFEEVRDREAESDLTRVLYLSPYQAEAHLLLGRIYLRTGRLREAIDALKVSIWSEETAAARVELAEAYLAARDSASARTEAERALVLDPGSVHAQKLLDRLRQPPSAPV